MEQYSDPKKDISVLKVRDAPFMPLNITKETYPNISVTVWGFPQDDLNNFPSGNDVSGTLLTSRPILWDSKKTEGQFKWNKKPRVKVNVLRFNGNCNVGFSGAPVCYDGDGRVVGMFEALDENSGYVIPIDIVTSLLTHSYNKIIAPRRTTNISSMLEKADDYFDQKDFNRAIKYYDKVINDPTYIDAYYKDSEGLRLYNNVVNISYPYDWKVEENNSKYNIATFLAPSLNSSVKHSAAIGIFVQELPYLSDEESLFNAFSLYQIKHIDKHFNLTSIDTSQLSGSAAYQVDFNIKGKNVSYAWTIKNYNVYGIMLVAYNSTTYLQQFSEMKESLKIPNIDICYGICQLARSAGSIGNRSMPPPH